MNSISEREEWLEQEIDIRDRMIRALEKEIAALLQGIDALANEVQSIRFK